MTLRKIHHVAYGCNDPRVIVNFYRDPLGIELSLAIDKDLVQCLKS